MCGLKCNKQVFAWRAGDIPRLHYHLRRSRKWRFGWAMKSPPFGKDAWVDIAGTKF